MLSFKQKIATVYFNKYEYVSLVNNAALLVKILLFYCYITTSFYLKFLFESSNLYRYSRK